MKALELQEAITFDTNIEFENGYIHWKSLDDWNPTMIFFYRKESKKIRGNFETPLG